MMMPALVMFRHRLAGQAGEIRQLRQGDVHAERARAIAITRDAGAKLGRQIGGCDQALEQQRRIEVGGNDRGRDAPAVHQLHPRRLAPVDQHLPDRRIGQDLYALSGAGLCHRLGDGAHAADRVAPGALLAIHLAEGVVQHHIGRARAVGTGVVAHHRIEAEGSLDRLAFEPTISGNCARFR